MVNMVSGQCSMTGVPGGRHVTLASGRWSTRGLVRETSRPILKPAIPLCSRYVAYATSVGVKRIIYLNTIPLDFREARCGHTGFT